MIPDYVRGLLSAADAKEVEAALECSPEIYPEFEAAQSYYSALNQIPEVKAPTGFIDRVNSSIDHKPLWPRVRGFLFEPLFIKLPLELAGLAACLVVALIVFNPFSLRERFAADKALALRQRSAATAVAHKPAEIPAAEAASDKTAAEPAPQPMPQPPALAVAEAGQPEVKAEIPPAAAPASQLSAQPGTPPRPAGLASAKEAEKKAPVPAEVRSNAAKLDALADLHMEKKAETEQEATAPEPAAVAARSASAAGTQALASAPARPVISGAAPAPAAAPAVRKPAAKAAAAPAAEDIGSVDLSLDPLSSSSTADNAEMILQAAVNRCKRTTKNGNTAFDCTIPPARLNLLIESLSRSFTVTTHLFPYDTETAKLVKVLFVIQ